VDQIIRAVGVRKVYRSGTEVEALRKVDLDVARGEIMAIVGPSGSGKTTLLNCLSGLEHIDEGEILIDGTNLEAMSDNDRTSYRAQNMGFVFQAFNLLPVLTAVENVEIPLLLVGKPAKESRGTRPTVCRAANNSASPSPARSCTPPRSSGRTSPPETSTRNRRSPSWISSSS
jgi:ABC-type lipoprotein export system ATPase subunit